jgi:hypothetical protein
MCSSFWDLQNHILFKKFEIRKVLSELKQFWTNSKLIQIRLKSLNRFKPRWYGAGPHASASPLSRSSPVWTPPRDPPPLCLGRSRAARQRVGAHRLPPSPLLTSTARRPPPLYFHFFSRAPPWPPPHRLHQARHPECHCCPRARWSSISSRRSPGSRATASRPPEKFYDATCSAARSLAGTGHVFGEIRNRWLAKWVRPFLLVEPPELATTVEHRSMPSAVFPTPRQGDPLCSSPSQLSCYTAPR